MTDAGHLRALSAITATGIAFTVTIHGPVRSLAEAAAARGLAERDLIKTMVVRVSADSFVFVLVPGDRTISWPPLRTLLGTNRLSMPDGATALAATGFRPGTITPFGSATPWPVVADTSLTARTVSIGGGADGHAFTVHGDDLVLALAATLADIAKP